MARTSTRPCPRRSTINSRLAGISSTMILIPRMVRWRLFRSACQGLDEMLNVAVFS